MKRMIITLAIALQIAHGNVSANETGVVHQVRHLLAQVESSRPSFRHAGVVLDNYRAVMETPEYTRLTELVSENWEEILKNTGEIAGSSETHQVILFISFSSLPQEDIYQCLNTIADLCLSGVISERMFYWILNFYWADTPTGKALALNYDNPVVVDFLQKAKVIQPKMSDVYDSYLSGAKKKKVIAEMAGKLTWEDFLEICEDLWNTHPDYVFFRTVVVIIISVFIGAMAVIIRKA